MRGAGRIGGLAAALCVAAGTARAQEREFVRQVGFYDEIIVGDRIEGVLAGGLVLEAQDIEARAERGLLVFDRDRRKEAADDLRRPTGLPRVGYRTVRSRRALTPDVMRERLARFLGSMRRKPTSVDTPPELDFELLRSFYLEGGVEIVHEDRIVARAERMMYSVVDDRAVLEDVELRLFHVDANGQERIAVVRTERLVREGPRMVGRDISVTACGAGEPHWEVFSGEAEIIERGDEFEIRSRDNWLAFSGRRLVPLPDAKQFTGSRSNYWIQGARAGYSNRQGVELGVAVGGPMNTVGGWLHNTLTGRAAEEFRGDWELDVGWIEQRGFPLSGELSYGARDLYEGRTRGFYLDDRGENIREIRNYIDGTLIEERNRGLFDTRNRVWLADRTSLDVQAFYAGDPAVLSEFYPGEFLTFEEVPETSVHFRHAHENRRLSVLGRWNIASDGFSYDSSRALAPSFVEVLPRATFDWISQPLVDLPGDAPLMLTSSTQIGHFRSRFDERFATPVDMESTRFDQELELAVPFQAGPFGVRVFAGARYTYWSDTPAASSEDRVAYTAGASIGTRLARTFEGTDGEAVRHVVSPTVKFSHVFDVDGEPADYYQFDPVDAIDELANVRIGLLQRFQRRTPADEDDEGDGEDEITELLWLDLAQNLFPIADRDNGGNDLGLFEFEVILRPTPNHFVVDDLTFLVEGEQDWDASELRTFNTYASFEALTVTWYGGYREDRTQRGTIAFGAEMPVRERWLLGGVGSWDLQADEFLAWTLALVRRDHDWQLAVSLRRDEIVDETSFSVDFVPELGGLFRARGPRTGVGDSFGGYRFTEW